jgi:hypothetical protein
MGKKTAHASTAVSDEDNSSVSSTQSNSANVSFSIRDRLRPRSSSSVAGLFMEEDEPPVPKKAKTSKKISAAARISTLEKSLSSMTTNLSTLTQLMEGLTKAAPAQVSSGTTRPSHQPATLVAPAPWDGFSSHPPAVPARSAHHPAKLSTAPPGVPHASTPTGAHVQQHLATTAAPTDAPPHSLTDEWRLPAPGFELQARASPHGTTLAYPGGPSTTTTAPPAPTTLSAGPAAATPATPAGATPPFLDQQHLAMLLQQLLQGAPTVQPSGPTTAPPPQPCGATPAPLDQQWPQWVSHQPGVPLHAHNVHYQQAMQSLYSPPAASSTPAHGSSSWMSPSLHLEKEGFQGFYSQPPLTRPAWLVGTEEEKSFWSRQLAAVPDPEWANILQGKLTTLPNLLVSLMKNTETDSHKTLTTDGAGRLGVTDTKPKLNSPLSFLEAFTIYTAANLVVFPSRALEMLGYQLNLIRGLRRHKFGNVMSYDQAIRSACQAGQHSLLKHDPHTYDLWLREAHNPPELCSFCLKAHDHTTLCSSDGSQASSLPCRRFNELHCSTARCTFAHKCSSCGGPHSAQKCNTLATTSSVNGTPAGTLPGK